MPPPARLAALAAAVLFAGALAGGVHAKGPSRPGPGERAVVAAALRSVVVPPELALAAARAGRDDRFRGAGVPRAVGVMHVLPRVAWAELGLRAHELWEARANAGVGVALLERLYLRHGERWDLALSHYRAGPLPRCGSGHVPHAHTIDFVASVMEWWRRYQKEGAVAAIRDRLRNGTAVAGSGTTGANSDAGGGRSVTGTAGPGGSRARPSVDAGSEGRLRSGGAPARGGARPQRFF